jgi:apolipoprotein N-acyltransferase
VIYLASALTGALMFQVWRPGTLPWTLPFVFAPLMFAWLSCTSLRKAFICGWIAQFIQGLLVFGWLRHTAFTFYGLGTAGQILFLVGFAAISHLQWPLAGAGALWLKKRFALGEVAYLAVIVLLAVLVEMICPRFFDVNYGQPWMWSRTPVYQLAEWTGFAGLSFLTFALSALTVLAVRRRTWKTTAVACAAFAFLLATAFAAGEWRRSVWSQPNQALRAHLFQINIDPIEVLTAEKGKEAAMQETLTRFFSDQQLGDPRPQLAIWSETAMPFDVTAASPELTRLKEFVRREGVPLITGAYRYEGTTKFNTAAYFDRDGNLLKTFDKHYLMPFGEYLPMESMFPWLRTILPQVPNYGRGRDRTPFEVDGAKLALSICYDGTFPAHFRKSMAYNPNVFLNITGEYWFGETWEPYQHNALVMGRAVEFRRPMIRVADTGITSVMLANGDLMHLGPVFEPWQDTLEIPYFAAAPRTVFDLYGAWYPIAVLAMVSLILVFAKLRQNREQDAHPRHT